MRCRACRCTARALDGGDLCDPHQEAEDDGLVVRRRAPDPPPKRPTGRPRGTIPSTTRHSEVMARARAAVAAMMEDRRLKRNRPPYLGKPKP